MNNKKTIEEVKKHCVENGYCEKARVQICAFLVGAGLKRTQDVLKFKVGKNSFDDFVKWYNSKTDELILERGRFVLIDNHAEVYPALILEEFEDACLVLSDTGLFCIEKDVVLGYASIDDISHVLESLIDCNLYWDCDKQKLLPCWHVKKTIDEVDC